MFFRIFGGSGPPSTIFGRILGRFVIFWGSRKFNFSAQKSAKGAVAFLEQFRLIGTGADLVPTGCDLASIWLQGRIVLDFGMVFGRFWDGFWDDFGRIFNEFWDRSLMKIQ